MTSTRSTRSATGFSPSATTTAKSRGRSSGPSPAKTSTASSPASPTASPISGSRPKNQNFRPAVLAKGHTVAGACKAANVGRTTAYQARQRDEEFAVAWRDLEEHAIEVLEAEAYRRAMNGSDKLMAFLLKARRPDVYRERVDVRHSDGLEVRQRVRRRLEVEERAQRMTREEQERYLLGEGIVDGMEQERENFM